MNAPRPDMRATPSELAQYARDGYFTRTAVLSESELGPLREGVEAIHAKIEKAAQDHHVEPPQLIDGKRYQTVLGSSVQWEWREPSNEIRTMEPYHHLDARLDALTDDIRLWGPARAVVKSEDLSLFSDKLNFKRPGGAPFPWHQDNPYWAFRCNHLDRLVSLAVLLDDSTVDNGCLWLIPGSHRYGALDCFDDRGVVGRLYTDIDRYELAEPKPIDLPAGSLVYFGGDLVHGSQSNKTDERRRLLLLTYQPAGLPRWQRDDVRAIAR